MKLIFFFFLSQQASQSGYDALVYAAKRETLVMPNDPIPELTPVDHRSLRTHYLSQVIMHQQNMSTHGVPKSTTADGNCFFHAISLALYGTEQYSTEMRLRTCVQMCLHPQVYKNRADANDIFILSPPFEDSAVDCSRPTHQFGQCLQQPMHLVYQLRPSTHHLMAIKTYLLRYSTQFSMLAPYGSQAPILT